MKLSSTLAMSLAAVTTLVMAGCSPGDGGSSGSASATNDMKHGPIKLWYSTIPEEKTWATQLMNSWNASHPKEQVTGETYPQGKDADATVIAAITAGTSPCLYYNGDPAGTTLFTRAGGLVDLSHIPDANQYIEQRSGAKIAKTYQYQGDYYGMPWKSGPRMIYYNKDVFRKAGLDTDHPKLSTYDDVLAAARAIVKSGAAKYAFVPYNGTEYFASWWDWYPLYIAQTGGKQVLSADGKPAFGSPESIAIGNFYRTLFAEKLIPTDIPKTFLFGDGQAAMQDAGPFLIPSLDTAKNKFDYGVVPEPTQNGKAPGDTWTFADSKTIMMFSNCPNKGTAWDFMKYSTSAAADKSLLELTKGQPPIRADLETVASDYLAKNPIVKLYADQGTRIVDSSIAPNMVQVWQDFRDRWRDSVIYGKGSVDSAFADAQSAAEADLKK